jgi:hypothetical protein
MLVKERVITEEKILRVCEDRENMINVRNYTFEEAYQL